MVSSVDNSKHEPVRFSLRTLMIVVAAVSIVLGVTLWHYRGLKGTHLSAVRDAYVHGRITIEEAREQVGNITDSWPADVHARARAAREQRRKL